jgi:hypothetical protein
MSNSVLHKARRALIPDTWWARIRYGQRFERVAGPLTYNQDGLATVHNADFMREPRFARAYALGRATGSWGVSDVHWRAYVACWAAERALQFEGDFVECGVNRGGLARAIIDYTRFDETSRRFFLLDTFAGLVDEHISDEERALGRHAGGYAECFEDVRETFSPFPNVVLVRGSVPGTLPAVSAGRIAFLSLDMNCALPEIAAAEHFWDRLASGAAILLDDYGWPGHIVQKEAFDRFAARRGLSVLGLPTGQGLLFKP